MSDWLNDIVTVQDKNSSPKKNASSKYEFIWLRRELKKFIWKAFINLIPYLIWAIIFAYAYSRGGIATLLISVSLAVLYTIKNVGEELRKAIVFKLQSH